MSHQPERKEKDCLNCGTIVHGKYCHTCGQENIETHQSFWSLTKHFVYDIFHFDGKFFDTLKYLLFKPGKIVREYLSGKRVRYLDPIRMYLFTSAIFFIIFFSFADNFNSFVLNTDSNIIPRNERLALAHSLNVSADLNDSIVKKQLDYLLDTSYTIYIDKKVDKMQGNDSSFIISYHGKPYIMEPKKSEDEISGTTWANKKFSEKWAKYKRKHGDDLNAIIVDFSNTLLHRFPYLLFLSLPFFALILKLLYIRRKRFYSEHAVFTLYHYIFSFILLLFIFGFMALDKWLNWKIFEIINMLLLLIWGLYLLLSMKRFYRQGWGKTIFKFLLLNLFAVVIMTGLLTAFVFFSIFQL